LIDIKQLFVLFVELSIISATCVTMSHHTRKGSSYGLDTTAGGGETTPTPATTAAGSIASRVGGPNGRARSPSQDGLHSITSDADFVEVLSEMVKKGATLDVDTIQRVRAVLKEKKTPTQPTSSSTPQASPAVAPGSDNNNNPGGVHVGGSGGAGDVPPTTQHFINLISDSKGLPSNLLSSHQSPVAIATGDRRPHLQQQPIVSAGAPTVPTVTATHINVNNEGVAHARYHMLPVDGKDVRQFYPPAALINDDDLVHDDIYIESSQRWAPAEVRSTHHHYRSFRARATLIRCKDSGHRYEVENLSLLIDMLLAGRPDVALEMAIRRIAGIEDADKLGNYTMAKYLNQNFAQPSSMGTSSQRRQAYKDIEKINAAEKSARGSGSKGSSSSSYKAKAKDKGKSKGRGGSGAKGAAATDE
jgi:hypothetical protein